MVWYEFQEYARAGMEIRIRGGYNNFRAFTAGRALHI